MRQLAVLALIALAAPPAAADDDAGASAPVRVQVELAGDQVQLIAHFVLELDGPAVAHDAAELALPPRAVVTGATAIVGGTVHPLALARADQATGTLAELALRPGGRDREAALVLRGGGTSGLAILDFAAPRSAELALDLELTAPTCFDHDTRYVELPAAWRDALDVAVAARARNRDPALATACHGRADASWVGFPARVPTGHIAAHAGLLALDGSRVARLELDLPRQLGEVPADLHTVLLVDGSRSVTESESDAQRAIAGAYLRAVPRTQVQVIAYARTAHALLPGWSEARRVTARVARELRAIEPRNGSDVAGALAAAGAWLARAGGTRRVIVFTDERLAAAITALEPTELARMLPAGTLVHVVAIDGDGELVRADGAALEPLAAATEGFAVRGGAGLGDDLDATMLARPISLDELAVHGPGWDEVQSDGQCDGLTRLDEGGGCRWWGSAGTGAGPITVEGLVWGRHVTRTLAPDPRDALELARELATTEWFDGAVQDQIDRAARALDPAWSLLATWGGRDGYADRPELLPSGIGLGGIGASARCGGTIIDDFGEPTPDLRSQLAPAVAACEPGRATVELVVETTREEIVGVRATVRGAPSPAAARVLEDCATEAVWRTQLALPYAPEHATAKLELGGSGGR